MIKVSILCMWVHDQDEALAFYRDKLGFDVSNDVTMEGFRWVTVRPPGQELEISLIEPEQSPIGPELTAQVRNVMAAGAMAGAIMNTDDCRAAFEALSAKGVEFTRPVSDEGFGRVTAMRLPGGGELGLYEPRHPSPLSAG